MPINSITPTNWRVLAIDDNPAIHKDYKKVLLAKGSDSRLNEAESFLFNDEPSESPKSKSEFIYEIDSAFQGEEGLEMVQKSLEEGNEYSVALIDVRMPPGMDGIETAKRIWQIYPELPIVLCTAYSDYGWEHISQELPQVDQLLILKKPFEPLELRQIVASQVSRWHLNRLAQGNKEHLQRIIQIRTIEVESTRDLVFTALAKLAESRDPETGRHLERIEYYTRVLLERLAVSGPYTDIVKNRYIDYVARSSILHDIGKVGIPDEILLKPGRLTTEEFEIMKTHAKIGADALCSAASNSTHCEFLKTAEEIARFHHERFNGTGYPNQLIGHEIPLSARIVSVADVYDALTTERTYKAAMCPIEAREIIESERSKHFDPAVVDAFVDCWDCFYETAIENQLCYKDRTLDDDYRPGAKSPSLSDTVKSMMEQETVEIVGDKNQGKTWQQTTPEAN